MRKILFSAIALMMSVTLWAAGAADSSKAINFDWDGDNLVKAGTTVEYSLGLHELVERANEPVIALYLNNRNASAAQVTVTVDAALHIDLPVFGKRVYAIDDFSEPTSYTIAGKGHEIWTLPTTFDLTDLVSKNSALKNLFEDPENVSLVDLCVNYGLVVSMTVTTDQAITISTEVFEEEEVLKEEEEDYPCTNSESFDWAGTTVEAGEKWFYIDLVDVKNANQKLNFVVENANGADAQVTFELYDNCPATSKLEAYVWNIPANGDKKESLGSFILNLVKKDYAYFKIVADQTVTLKAEAEELPAPTPADNLFDATAAATWTGEKLQIEAGVKTIVKVETAALKADKGYKTVAYVTNLGDTEATLTQTVSFEPKATIYNTLEKTLTLKANEQAAIAISSKMIESAKSEVVYFCFETDGIISIRIEKKELESSSADKKDPVIYAPACEDAFVFNWNSSLKLKAMQNKWYEFDIKPLKQNGEHLQLSFTNHSDSMVIIMGSILLDCDSKDTIPYVLPVPGGKTMSKFIEYSLLAAAPLEKAYVSAMVIPTTITSLSDLSGIETEEDVMKLISLDLNTHVTLKATKSSAIIDGKLCEDAHETIKAGVKYTQEPGTQWYRVTDKMIKDMGLLSTFAIGNNGKAAANVTLGVTVGCNYGIHTRTSVSIPTWLDFATYYPNGIFYLVDAIVNEDITEFYVEVTTDQPIEFGFGVEIENRLGCDNAIDFDWSKGVTFQPKDPNWYKFDISELKANKEQVKLTFTNPTDSWAWVAAFATYDCPFKVGLPLVFPVPAKTSVDKWLDYSFLASTVKEELYFMVFTDSPLQLKAMKESAVLSTPVVDCENATLVEPNTLYTVNPGTSWYHISPAPFAKATGKSAKISFANKGSKMAKVTTGATVGCEYGILTRGKFPVPTMDVDANVPLWVFGLLKKFVDEDVNQYFVEITTDQPLQFRIDVELAEDVVPDVPVGPTPEHLYFCQGHEVKHPVNDTVMTNDLQDEFVFEYTKDGVDYICTVTPIFAGGPMTQHILDSIQANPVLAPGQAPKVDASIAAIKQYYLNLNNTFADTISELVKVEWQNLDAISECATTHTMTLVILDTCGNTLGDTFTFDVENYGVAADAGVTAEDIKVFCGQAIDVRIADEIIKKFIKDNEVGPNADYVWEEKNAEGNWVKMSLDAIPGTTSEVTVRYTIKTDCNEFTSKEFTLTVETPTYKNDPEDMDGFGLVARYGDRLLTVNLKQILEDQDLKWEVAEEDVTWYYAVGTDTTAVGNGYYLTTVDGTPLKAGVYFARVNHRATSEVDCDGTLQTIMHEVKAAADGPKLAPSVVQPQELISLYNLNAEEVSTISIYRTTGELIHSFQVDQQEQATFNAAQQTGYYLVEVKTETEKVSLRYIVK